MTVLLMPDRPPAPTVLVPAAATTVAANAEIPFAALEEIDYQQPLGEGAFGMVYRGVLNGAPVAIKHIKPSPSSDERAEADRVAAFMAEVRIMAGILAHPNVARLAGACVDHPPDLYLAIEFFKLGSLESMLHDRERVSDLAEVSVRTHLGLDIAAGLAHLHRNKVLHGDLAARNVLLRQQDGRLLACVADFGLAVPSGAAASLVVRPIPVR